LSRADVFAEKILKKYLMVDRILPSNGYRWFNDNGAGDYAGRPNNASFPTVRKYNQIDYGGLGAVATWFGVPIRNAKASNFLVAYAVRKISVPSFVAWVAQLVGTFNDEAASRSWDAGWAVAGGADYEATATGLVKEIFDKGDDKNIKLWPNLQPPDNHVAESELTDLDEQFVSPGFTEMDAP
jgi:hypothetical protein